MSSLLHSKGSGDNPEDGPVDVWVTDRGSSWGFKPVTDGGQNWCAAHLEASLFPHKGGDRYEIVLQDVFDVLRAMDAHGLLVKEVTH